ncbi:MAG: Uma2 family endonuclease [Eisenbergiella massiliensis]
MTIEEMQERKRELGYSYEKLAEISGIPLGTVQKILGGITKTPRYETRRALETALAGNLPAEDGKEGACGIYPGGPSGTSVVQETAAAYGGKKRGEYTLEDYYKIPEEHRVELIDGVIYDMASPTSIHQLWGGEVYRELANYIRQNQGSCIPLISPLDVQLDCDDRTMVEPDVLVVCDRNKLKKGIMEAGFIAEILSPSTRRRDMSLKLAKYTEAGVREYWLVDPDKKKVIVYDLEHNELPSIYTFEDKVSVCIFDRKCIIDFSKIYENIRFLYESEQ